MPQSFILELETLRQENKDANYELILLYNERDDYRRVLEKIRDGKYDAKSMAIAKKILGKYPKIKSGGYESK